MDKEKKSMGEKYDIVATIKGFDNSPFKQDDKYALDLETTELGDILATGWGDVPSWINHNSVIAPGGLLAKVIINVVQGKERKFYNIKRVEPVTIMGNTVKDTKQSNLGDNIPTPPLSPKTEVKAENDAFILAMNSRIQALNMLSRVDSQQKIDLIFRNADKVAMYILSGVLTAKEKKKGDSKA